MSRILISFGSTDALGNSLADGQDRVVVAGGESYNCIHRDADTATSVSLVDSTGASTGLSCRTSSAFSGTFSGPDPGSDLYTYVNAAIRYTYFTGSTAAVEISGTDSITSIKALGYNANGRDTDFTHNSVTLLHDSDGSGSANVVGPPVEFTSISSAPRIVQAAPASGSSFGYLSLLEITTASGPTIDSVPATAFPGQSRTVTGTGFGATQGTGGLTVGGVTQTITSWSDTSITFTTVQGNNKYEAGKTLEVTTDAATTVSDTIELVADTANGFGYVDMSSPNTTDTSSVAYNTTPTVVTGDQFEWEDFNNLGNLTVDAQGFVSNVDTEGTFRGRFWDATDSTWGAVETFTASVPGEEDTWPFGKGINPAATKNWTWGRRHPKTNMRVRVYK